MSVIASERPRILIVDDYETRRLVSASFLMLEGYETFEAESGKVALDLIGKVNPDLILLDVRMPDIDGFEVCRRLKQDKATRLIPIVFITAMNDQASRIKGIEVGGDDFIIKPFEPLELSARVKSLVRQKRLNQNLDNAEQVLMTLARTVESRDPHTSNHCERLAFLGEAFGHSLKLSRPDIETLRLAGYLHDLGKIGVPDSILLKAGPLTPSERKIMEQHVLIGEQICQPLQTMQAVLPIIRHHHERWDGTGYPDGLVGHAIPYLAQVFQLLDIYDALMNERPYKPAFTHEQSLNILAEETNRGWRNPELFQQFSDFIYKSQKTLLFQGWTRWESPLSDCCG